MSYRIEDLSVRHLQARDGHEVKTAFGTMRGRHALLVRVEAEGGLWGWGESWVNFPVWAPWERRAAFEQAYRPYLLGRRVEDVGSFMAQMARDLVGPAQQSGTMGALLASLCAVELALWELKARAEGVGLNRLLFERPAQRVRVYASGIGTPLPMQQIDQMLAAGVTLFKLKVGFGLEQDLENLQAMKRHLGSSAELAVDANRAWTYPQAAEWTRTLKEFGVKWLEEPLRADQESHYPLLQQNSPVSIAVGENVWVFPGSGIADFAAMAADFLQPDITKNCTLHAARQLLDLASGAKVVPHYLGSAVGQAASIHLASGCPLGLVEWDINPNPLRTDLFGGEFGIEEGQIAIPERPGLGWQLDESALARWE